MADERRMNMANEDDEKEKDRVFKEFECPDCDADNPSDDGFVAEDEVRCFYCGSLFIAKVSDSGRLKMVPE